MFAQNALKFDVRVPKNGRIELDVPFSVGEHVTIFVVQNQDSFTDLLSAATSQLDFWDNPWDDEDWNNA